MRRKSIRHVSAKLSALLLLLASLSPVQLQSAEPWVSVKREDTALDVTYQIIFSEPPPEVLFTWRKQRPLTEEETRRVLQNPAYSELGIVPKRWINKDFTVRREDLPRLERAFEKFKEWDKIAKRENIHDATKVIDEIAKDANSPTSDPVTIVFVAPISSHPAKLRIQHGVEDDEWNEYTSHDLAMFDTLLKQLPEMEVEAKRKKEELLRKAAKEAAEKRRIDELLK